MDVIKDVLIASSAVSMFNAKLELINNGVIGKRFCKGWWRKNFKGWLSLLHEILVKELYWVDLGRLRVLVLISRIAESTRLLQLKKN